MNRTKLKRLAESRLEDAKVLLANGRWGAAYYVAGYALELALKSCILKRLEDTGFIFEDRNKMENLGKQYWVHRPDALMTVAELTDEKDALCKADPTFGAFWGIAKNWNENCRYSEREEQDARDLLAALVSEPSGVMAWLRKKW